MAFENQTIFSLVFKWSALTWSQVPFEIWTKKVSEITIFQISGAWYSDDHCISVKLDIDPK
jgi:hypothetical protein